MNEYASVAPVAAFAACVVVGIFSFWDFHGTISPNTLRYSVSQRRYFLATGVFVLAHVVFYLLALGVFERVAISISLDRNAIAHNSNNSLPGGYVFGIRQISLMYVLLLTILFPYVPGLKQLNGSLRRFSHFIALYPESMQLALSIITRAGFQIEAHSGDIEGAFRVYSVSNYGVPRSLSRSALNYLSEALFLRHRFAELSKELECRRFLRARSAVLKNIDLELERIIERIAKAVLSFDSLDRVQSNLVSQFAAEDLGAVITKYRSLIAQAAMSCFYLSSQRERFIASFGYNVTFPPMIPFVPLLVIFGLDFVVLLWPLVVSPWISFGSVQINNPQQSWGFEWEPPKAVMKDSGTRDWTLWGGKLQLRRLRALDIGTVLSSLRLIVETKYALF